MGVLLTIVSYGTRCMIPDYDKRITWEKLN